MDGSLPKATATDVNAIATSNQRTIDAVGAQRSDGPNAAANMNTAANPSATAPNHRSVEFPRLIVATKIPRHAHTQAKTNEKLAAFSIGGRIAANQKHEDDDSDHEARDAEGES